MLNFNWSRMDDAAAQAVTELINARFSAWITERNNRAAANGGGGFMIEALQITSLDWGRAPPFLELHAIRPALDFGSGIGSGGGGGAAAASAPGVPTQSGGAAGGSGVKRETASLNASPSRAQATVSSGERRSAFNTSSFNGSGASGVASRGSGSDIASQSPLTHVGDVRRTAGSGGSAANSTTAAAAAPVASGKGGDGVTNASDIGSAGSNPTPRGDGDSLAPFLGDSGLHLQFHLTYGGDLRLGVAVRVAKYIDLGPTCVVAAMLPLQLTISHFKLNAMLNLNLHHNACRVWLEPGPVPPFLEPLHIVTVIGASDHRSLDDADSTLVDEKAIAELVTAELRAVVRHKLMSPHFVTIPIRLGGSAGADGSGTKAQHPSEESTPRTSVDQQ